MDVLHHPGRQYRRFRNYYRFERPLLVFFADAFITLAKISLFVAGLLMIWILSHKFAQSVRPSATQSLQTAPEPTASKNTLGSTSTNPKVVVQSGSSSATLAKATFDTEPTTDQNRKEKNRSEDILTATEATEENTRIADIAPSINIAVKNTEEKILLADIAKGTTAAIVDEQWINELNPNHFIIQYGSAMDLELLNNFITRINNDEEIAIYPYRKTPSGRLVYGIATGVHTNRQAALASLDELTTEARAYKPWVRPVKELIKEINEVAN